MKTQLMRLALIGAPLLSAACGDGDDPVLPMGTMDASIPDASIDASHDGRVPEAGIDAGFDDEPDAD